MKDKLKIKLINSIKKVTQKLGYDINKANTLQERIDQSDLLNELMLTHTNPTEDIDIDNPAEVVIFSMDRAIQLHALLSSFYENINKELKVHILYKSNSEEHKKAYDEVIEIFKDKDINFVVQESKQTFRPQLINILESIKKSRVFFLVDDILFKEKIDVKDLTKYDARDYILSLRMSPSYTRCYTSNVEQKVPEFSEKGDYYKWIWEEGEYDWNYPISVDGHVFLTKEILSLAKFTQFNTPNTFEGNLQIHRKYFLKRFGICYPKSKIVNLPINKVNTDTENLFGDIDVTFLLNKWNEGKQINYKEIYGFNNISAHQEIPISFINRK